MRRVYLFLWVFAIYSFYNFFFNSSPSEAQAATPGAGQGFGMFLPLLLVFVIFYFLVLRPQQKQAKQRLLMIKGVVKGDQVVTVGGILGKVTGVADEILTIEIADNCKIKMERSGIQTVKKAENA